MSGKNDYPSNWPEIAKRIKDMAGWRCENCGHPHDVEAGYMLTVHHLDMYKPNCDYKNLVALCQRCHLRIQAKYKPGQLMLIPYPWAEKRGLV
jgi:DNA-directed RNA polymerase subunit RPC12/RpoP